GLLWADIRIVLIIIMFVFLLKWTLDFTKSKAVGVILATLVAYLTFYSHFELLMLILVVFFCYPFLETFSKAFNGGGGEKK
ncbi:MAG: hypothetical protein V1911_01280, partial [Candidatus Micrarchaeota archaeon]